MRKIATAFAGLALMTGLFGSSDANAGREPAQAALENRNTELTPDVVQNRFFLKERTRRCNKIRTLLKQRNNQ